MCQLWWHKNGYSNIEGQIEMAKLLYIMCELNPAEKSPALFVASKFLNEYLKRNPSDEIHVLDLYRDYIQRIDADILSGWEKINQGHAFVTLADDEQRKISRLWKLTDQFIAADKYVFVTPMWNIGFPAEFKMYIDAICVLNKTFEYTHAGPEGLLKKRGKKCFHIHTASRFYRGKKENPTVSYFNFIMNFMGIEKVETVVIEGTGIPPEQVVKAMLSAVRKAKREAAFF
jgi:FMN-dependent NADH-azoreductase